VLAAQRGYQGALTLFRDIFVKIIRNVDSSALDITSPGSWTVRKETDGSTSVLTLGQNIVPEIMREYKRRSKVSYPKGVTLDGSEGYKEFETQPEGRHYVLQGTLEWTGGDSMSNMPIAGFRVLASNQEWTDIYFDPGNETLVVNRSFSSLVPSCTSASY
jgi:beta-fructofuranosidase